MLYTDLPTPTPLDVGETLSPVALDRRSHNRLVRTEERLTRALAQNHPSSSTYVKIDAELNSVKQTLLQYAVHQKIIALRDKQRRDFVKGLAKEQSFAGFLTYGVEPSKRQWYLDTKQLVFAITKYGKEGMDCPDLDTVILSSLFSGKNGLQQLMGRPTRPMPGKKSPLIVLLVDDIGQCIGMSKKLQGHLRTWPKEEGGPYEFILTNYPNQWTNQKTISSKTYLIMLRQY
jgi:superfamily II DNA or RNA helicase